MPLMRFSNNAEATTATLLLARPDWETYPDDEELANANYLGFEIGAADDPELFHYFSSEVADGGVQPLTLTHDSVPGAYEIVYLNARSDRRFTVERGQEGTTELEWPIGTTVSANVTAGMLGSLLQDDGEVAKVSDNGSILLGSGSSASEQNAPIRRNSFLFRSRADIDRLVQFGAYPALHAHLAEKPSDRGAYSIQQDLALGHEATGVCAHVDIGVPAVWTPDMYYRQGSVVVPTTPNGYQYWLDVDTQTGHSETSTSAEPAFLSDGYCVPIYVGDVPNEMFIGNWVPIPMPVECQVGFAYRLMVTEVGFIGRVDGTPTQWPTLSVGTTSNPTLLVNAVTLDQLVPASGLCAHRIPVAAGGILLEELLFSVPQMAVGASIKGRFYWRGIFYSDR